MENDTWTIRRMVEWMEGYLSSHGDKSPRISTQWLISDATGLSRIELYTDLDRPLSVDELAKLKQSVKRRASGEPLQYITGDAPFRHINVSVREGVLIPRPETEVLVSELLTLLPKPEKVRAREYLNPAPLEKTNSEGGYSNFDDADAAETTSEDQSEDVMACKHDPIFVADLCTGSGCIACALAYEHPDIEVVATDISAQAVEVARENVCTLGLKDRIKVVECDLADCPELRVNSLDAIISNPPYIPSSLINDLPDEVHSFEPSLALDGGADGLDVYAKILDAANGLLKEGGVLAVELHETTLDQAKNMACSAGFKDVRITYDLAGKPRIITARK